MPTGLFLVPLFSGYLFLHLWDLCRFRVQQHDGYRLLIESFTAGLPISLFAFFLSSTIRTRGWDLFCVERMAQQTHVEYLGTGILAGIIAIVLGLILSSITPRTWSKSWILEDQDDGFLRLAFQAAMEEVPLSITLKNRKVYIGLIVRTPNMKPGQRHIGVLPLVSGYRDPTTLRLIFTEDYKRVYRMDGVNPANFEVTVPLDDIQSANFFDPDIYPKFSEPAGHPPASPGRRTSDSSP